MRFLFLYILASLLILSSCNHKELCFHHPHTAKVRINVDWSEFKKETPSGMTVMIYPQQGGKPIRHLSNTISHAIVDLEAGLYNSIVFNQSEAEFGPVSFVDMDDFSTAKIVVNDGTSRWYTCSAEGECLAKQPEWIATDIYTDALVTDAMVEAEIEEYMASMQQRSGTRVNFVVAHHTPQNIIHTINVKVHFSGIYNLLSARASLTGLAEGYTFSTTETTEAQVTQLLESWSLTQNPTNPTQGYITSQITCMGLPLGHDAEPADNKLTLSVLLVDGKTIIDIPFLVGDKFVKRYDESGKFILEYDVELWVDEPLPDVQPSDSGGGGFNATVDDWGDEQNIDLGL